MGSGSNFDSKAFESQCVRAGECLAWRRGRSPLSYLLRLCSGAGLLSAVSAFCDAGELMLYPLFRFMGGVIASGPAWPYAASLLAFCVLFAFVPSVFSSQLLCTVCG